jgi:hypothetical protein
MHKAINCSLIILFLLSSVIILNINFAQAADKNLPSIISSDTTLTKDGSPYSLIGPTRINSGVTLTIEAGATLNIGTNYLQVDGILRSKGTSSNNAEILSTLPIRMEDSVGYINFTSSCTSWNEQTGSGCIIENTLLNQTIIHVGNSTVKINSNTVNFQGNMMVDNVAVSIKGGSTPVTNNIIHAAVMISDGTSTISGNKITGGLALYGGTPTAKSNNVSGGSTYVYFAKDENRVYNTIAIGARCSPTLLDNEVHGSIHVGDYRGYAGPATINNNRVYGSITGQGNLAITNNKIFGGISTTSTNVNIQGNQISGSTQTGVSVSDNAVVKYNSISGFNVSLQVNPSSSGTSSPTIKNNNIQNWSQYCFKNSASNDVEASNNWWGTTDVQAIEQDIYDQTYDFNLGKVNITPILNAPDTQSPETLPVQTSPTPTATVEASPTPTVPEYSIVAFFIFLAAATLVFVISVRKLPTKTNLLGSK